MNKYIGSVFPFNEPVPLLVAEPFYCSFCQNTFLLVMVDSRRLGQNPKGAFFIYPACRKGTKGPMQEAVSHDIGKGNVYAVSVVGSG